MATATRIRFGLGLAVAVALLLVVGLIMLAALFAGIQPSCDSTAAAATGGPPSAQARAAIPAHVYPLYLRAQARYGVPWNVLGAINYVETDFGRNTSTSSAGAQGWMQFMPDTWASYRVDGNDDGRTNINDPADAIAAAARYLKANGAPRDLRRAIFAYNHATWYVSEVLAQARALTDTGTLVASITTTAGACDEGGAEAVGPANLTAAVQRGSPRRYATLPGWAMAEQRVPEQVDARILPDVVWVLRRYGLRVTAARAAGHHTHGDGTAIDLVPATGGSQAVWDASARRLAVDLGWTPGCASSGVAPVCALKPAIRGVFYNGYPGHGDPAHCSGLCQAHLHVSWFATAYGAAGLAPPNAWVRVFAVPAEASA